MAGFFVDFENFYYDILNNYKRLLIKEPFDVIIRIIEDFKSTIKKQGIDVLVGRAYGDWDQLSDVLSDLYFLFLTPIFSLCKKGKSSADIELSLDVLELMIDRSDINIFIILGGDRDYMPVVRRLREKGKEVIIAGLMGSISGDLRKNVGDDKCVALDELLKQYIKTEEIESETTVSKINETVSEVKIGIEQVLDEKVLIKKEISSEEIKQEREFSEEEIEKCIELLIKAREHYKSRYPFYETFKIGYFYKDFMNDNFPAMTNTERKGLLNKLEALGIFKTKTIYSSFGLPPTVVEIIEDHPSVQKIKEALAVVDKANAQKSDEGEQKIES